MERATTANLEERLVKEMEYANAQRNLAALFWKALREIAYMRPGGPSTNAYVEKMERVAIDALSAGEALAAKSTPPLSQEQKGEGRE